MKRLTITLVLDHILKFKSTEINANAVHTSQTSYHAFSERYLCTLSKAKKYLYVDKI